MKSKVVATYEIDDIETAVEELLNKINEDFTFLKNTCAIIFCASDMDQQTFMKHIKNKFPYDIIGCTGISTLDSKEGFHELCITMLVLTADDCDFSVAFSEQITTENVYEQVEKTYQAAKAITSDEIKLLIALPPYNLNIMLDEFTNAFNKAAPGIPVFGGLPSYRGEDDSNLTLYNNQATSDKLVLLAITGNIKPIFSRQLVKGSTVERKRTVTSAKSNVVYTVGDQRFTDYMKEVGLPVEKLTDGNSTITFVANPLLLEHVKNKDGENFSFIRTLHKIDLEEGSATAIGQIPEGATVSICSLKREEIAEAAFEGMHNLSEKMSQNSNDYEYSTILAVSCIGRYLLMSPNSHIETTNMIKVMPENLNLCGFYSYGEIAPLYSNNKEITNFAHNESLILCAF